MRRRNLVPNAQSRKPKVIKLARHGARRWRSAMNLWVVAVALPLGLAAHARALGGASTAGHGARRRWRRWSALGAGAWLDARAIAGVGAAGRVSRARASLPQALAAAEVTARVRAGGGVGPGGASLVAYLVAVARAQARAERAGDGSAPATRRLHQDPMPSRWRRRLRVYRGFAGGGDRAFRSLLVGGGRSVAVVHGVAGGVVRRARGARAGAGHRRASGLLWIVLLRAYVLAPLHGHLQHDRDLLRAMESDRRHARRGPSARRLLLRRGGGAGGDGRGRLAEGVAGCANTSSSRWRCC